MKRGDLHSPVNLVKISIEHPYAVIAFYLGVLALAVLVIGYAMPRRMMPYVQSPMIGIVNMMPGLSAMEMETYFSKPVEERMVNVQDVRYIRSTSQEGFSIVTLEFPYGTNMDRMLVQVQALMNVVQADLPITGANVKPAWVLLIDPLNLPVLSLNLTGDERWDLARLRELADNEITNRLKASSGQIYTVSPFGGHRRQLQVILDKQKLAAYDLSPLDIREAIDRQNIAKPAGALTSDDTEITLRVGDLATDAATVAAYPIRSANGATVYLKDVARVSDTVYEPRSAFHFLNHGKTEVGIALNILQNPSASSPSVIASVTGELERLERDYPGVDFKTAYDNSAFVKVLMHNMFEELLIAILLTALVVLFFLGNWRSTVIAMVDIPTSLALAILCMVPFGYSLNSSTLVGLLVAIGRLVDDAIIDIHSVQRHLAMGKSPHDATIDGISEVRRSVAAATAMLVLALLPLVFCGGIVQFMFEGLVWPIIFALVASYFESMTLTAVMCAAILRREDPSAKRDRFTRSVLLPFQQLLERLEGGYRRLIAWMLRNRFSNLARIFATIIIGFGFYYFIGSEMMPLADVGQGYMQLEMEPGTSYAATERAVRQIETIMAKHPELTHAAIEIGFEGGPGMTGGAYFSGYSMGQVNGAMAMLTFTDKDTRARSIFEIIDSIQKEALETVPGIRKLQIKEMGSDVMASSQAPITLLVAGPDLRIVADLAEQTAEIARTQVPDMFQVGTGWSLSRPTYQLHIDTRRALEIGLTPTEVADQLYYATRGGYTMEFYRPENKRQTTIQVRFDETQRANIQDVMTTMLRGDDGKLVPLSAIAEAELTQTPSLIEHDNLRRVASVTGFYRMEGRPSMDVAMDLMARAQTQLNWPQGYKLEVRGDMTQMMDSFRRLLIGLQIALIFIFLMLVAQFRGFIQPLQMVFSVPLELAGVFLLLWLQHQSFSTVSVMGIIVLSGMDITTAILLIDHIAHYRARGMPRNEAVLQACPERLRPILMTSLITIITLTPVAFFPSTGLDAYSPLGSVVIGGLLVGTVLSLLDIPIMHTLMDDVAHKLNRVRRRSNAEPEPAHEEGSVE